MSAARMPLGCLLACLALAPGVTHAQLDVLLPAIGCDGRVVDEHELAAALVLELAGTLDGGQVAVAYECDPERAIVRASLGATRVERSVELGGVSGHLRARMLALVARELVSSAARIDGGAQPPSIEPAPAVEAARAPAIAGALGSPGEPVVAPPAARSEPGDATSSTPRDGAGEELELALLGGVRTALVPSVSVLGAGAQVVVRRSWLAIGLTIEGYDDITGAGVALSLALGVVPLRLREGALELWTGLFGEVGLTYGVPTVTGGGERPGAAPLLAACVRVATIWHVVTPFGIEFAIDAGWATGRQPLLDLPPFLNHAMFIATRAGATFSF